MRLVIVFAILAVSHARYTAPECDNVLVHNIQHEKETLVDGTDSPYQLAIDYDTSTLFFSFSDKSNEQIFSSAYINLKTNEYATIPGISGGFANVVDNKKHKVFLGGNDGIYEFDYDTKTARHLDGSAHSVWQMFFKKDVYYTTFPVEQVYVYRNGRAELVRELADTNALLVALNNDLDFYYTNSSGMFKRSKSGETTLLGDYNANSMTADDNGNLYFSTPSGIYLINEKDKINEIASVPNIYGVAVESNGNLIYAAQTAVVRLKPTKTPCFVDEKNVENVLV